LSGWVGATAAALAPLTEAFAADMIVSETLHGDDAPVPGRAPGSGKPRPGGSGLTFVTSGRLAASGLRRHCSSARRIGRASTSGLTSSPSRVCCAQTAAPVLGSATGRTRGRASTDCSRPGGSSRPAAERMSAASSLIFLQQPLRRSPKRRSTGSAGSTPSRRPSTDHPPTSDSSSARSDPDRSPRRS
jgi:hypothetical protein